MASSLVKRNVDHPTGSNPVMSVVLSRHARDLIPNQVASLIEGLKAHYSVYIHDPTTDSSPLALADVSKSDSYRSTLVIGGDGTLNWALNTLGINRPFAVFPAGTANDLATHLDLSRDVEGTLRTIRAGNTVAIDLIKVNDRFFATAGGGGLPAECALWVSSFRDRGSLGVLAVGKLGPLAYELSAVGNILLRKSIGQELGIIVERSGEGDIAQEMTLNSPGFLVTNQGTLAGRLRVAPGALNNDGLFEIFVLSAASRFRLLRILLGLRAGTLARKEDFQCIQASNAVVTCKKASRFFGDGELLAEDRVFRLRVVKKALKLICSSNEQAIFTVDESRSEQP
jgi:diacylglycerol kinase (ATP)